jgi:pSer/pThr/pTyr-binding forkhead associated (FHA) protein
MPAFLVPVDPGHCLIPLEKAIVLIGRQSDCDVALTLSRKISRKHCCIAQVDNKFVVRDLGSTNGVFLNGTRIKKEATLSIGDDLMIGDVHFRVQNEAKVISKPKSRVPDQPIGRTVSETPDAPIPVHAPIAVRSRATVADQIRPDLGSAHPADYDSDETSVNRQLPHRRNRVDDVIPLDDSEEAQDVMLASDSY